MSSNEEDLIGTTEAGKILGIDRKSVAKLCEDGKLEGAFQPLGALPGKHWRVPRHVVQAHRQASRPKKRQVG